MKTKLSEINKKMQQNYYQCFSLEALALLRVIMSNAQEMVNYIGCIIMC